MQRSGVRSSSSPPLSKGNRSRLPFPISDFPRDTGVPGRSARATSFSRPQVSARFPSQFDPHLLSVLDVWVTIHTYPYRAVDLESVQAYCAEVKEFAVFANGRMMQNIRSDEGGSRLLSALAGGGINAGVSPDSKLTSRALPIHAPTG